MWRRLLASLRPVHSSLRRGCVEATLGLTQSSPLVPAKGGGCGGDSRPHLQTARPCEGGGGVWRRLSASLSPVHSSLRRGGGCGGDSRPHSVQASLSPVHSSLRRGVCRRLSASLSPVHSSLRRGGCGGDFRPHSVQSTRPYGKEGVEATLGLTQSSPIVPAKGGVCGGDSRPHSVQSNCPCEGGGGWRRLTASLSPVQLSLRRGGGVEATHGLTKSSPIVPANGGCGGDSRPHSVQSTRPCERGGGCGGDSWPHSVQSTLPCGGGGVEATLGLTQSSPLVPAKVGRVLRRLLASLNPVHSSLWRGGCGGNSPSPLVPVERGVWRQLLTQSHSSLRRGGVWRRLSASLSPVHSSLRRGVWRRLSASLSPIH